MTNQEIKEKIQDVMYFIASNTKWVEKYIENEKSTFVKISPDTDDIYSMLEDIVEKIPGEAENEN